MNGIVCSHVGRKTEVMNLLEAAGFSRSNPYNIVKQGQVGGITWTYCVMSGTLHGVLKHCALIYEGAANSTNKSRVLHWLYAGRS